MSQPANFSSPPSSPLASSPGIPELNSTEEKARRAALESLPVTPPSLKRSRAFLPNTPRPKRLKFSKPVQPFNAPPLACDQTNRKISFHYPCFLEICGRYTISKTQSELCIKQPPQSKSCGLGATLMLLSHFTDKHQEFTLDDDQFWNWYMHATFVNQNEILNILQKIQISNFGYQPKGIYYHEEKFLKSLLRDPDFKRKTEIEYVGVKDFQDDLLNRLKRIQEQTSSPMIVSITNEKVGGHWIVLDAIEEDHVFIRDPYQGYAHKLPLEELYENWEAEDEVKIIYLESTATSFTHSSPSSSPNEHSS